MYTLATVLSRRAQTGLTVETIDAYKGFFKLSVL